MICLKRWENMTTIVRRKLMAEGYTFIPPNRYEMEPGYYSATDILLMLRRRKNEKEIVKFLLDMLE